MKGKKTGGRNFKAGGKGGPGRPPLPPEARMSVIREITQSRYRGLIEDFCSKTRAEIAASIENEATPMLELMIARVMSRAFEDGDPNRLEYFISRVIGRIPTEVNVEHTVILDQIKRLEAMPKERLRQLVLEAARAGQTEVEIPELA